MTKNIVKISEDVHSLSRQLHPSILDDLGLIRAAEAECMNFSRREGIEIVFNMRIFQGSSRRMFLSPYTESSRKG